jgi:PPK2 family polyphosphate:nucleotide phosphotransferase
MPAIQLNDISTRAPKDFEKEETKAELEEILQELSDLQNLLFAESKHAILVVLQGMDASGKDGLLRDVFSRMNPQGVQVKPFKVPTEEELSHDFLWRVHRHAPAKGMVQIFNRSHYEDVLVTRVHGMIDDKTAKARMKAINDFEQLLVQHNNTQILKFYLHVSAERQEERLQERLHDPAKMWKHNEGDLKEAKNRDKYIRYYEEVFEHCNAVPWNIIPADQNWYKEYLVAQKVREVLKGLDMQFPGLKRGE